MPRGSKKPQQTNIVRSSAAEYLTFIAATGDDSHENIELRYEDENIWLTQKMMAALYGVSIAAINQHIKKIFEDNELEESSVIKKYLMTASDGKNYNTIHYSLQMIIAVGFKVNNERAVQFRKWANQIVKDYTIQGWVMDEPRLKNGGSILTKDYFEKQLQKVREIRLSERRFYQKITDIYATSIDYDPSSKTTRRFFATVANKMHYAIHGNTAAEIIMERADSKKEHMGLTTWEDAPNGKIQQYDVVVAKNYLSTDEIRKLERIVSAYLDYAEEMAERHIPMTMEDWEERLNGFLTLWDKKILNNTGKVSAEIAKNHALTEFEKYRVIQDRLFESDFDKYIIEQDNCSFEKLEKKSKKTAKDNWVSN